MIHDMAERKSTSCPSAKTTSVLWGSETSQRNPLRTISHLSEHPQYVWSFPCRRMICPKSEVFRSTIAISTIPTHTAIRDGTPLQRSKTVCLSGMTWWSDMTPGMHRETAFCGTKLHWSETWEHQTHRLWYNVGLDYMLRIRDLTSD